MDTTIMWGFDVLSLIAGKYTLLHVVGRYGLPACGRPSSEDPRAPFRALGLTLATHEEGFIPDFIPLGTGLCGCCVAGTYAAVRHVHECVGVQS